MPFYADGLVSSGFNFNSDIFVSYKSSWNEFRITIYIQFLLLFEILWKWCWITFLNWDQIYMNFSRCALKIVIISLLDPILILILSWSFQSDFFEDVGVKTLNYLDSLFQWDNLQKSQFYKGLPTVIEKLPQRVCLFRSVFNDLTILSRQTYSFIHLFNSLFQNYTMFIERIR